MLFSNILWPAVLLPLLVAGGAVWLDPSVRRPPNADGEREPRSAWGGSVAFGAAYFGSHWAVAGWPPLPAVESSDWLAWLVVAAALGGVIVHTGRLRLADPILAALLFFGLSATTLRPMLVNTWTRAEGAVALGLLAFALSVVWLATIRLFAVQAAAARKSPERALRPASALVLSATFGFAGITLALSSTARLGMVAGAAGVAVLAIGAVAASTRGAALPGLAAAPALVTALVGLVANGLLYADLRPAGAIALLAAPLFGLVGSRAAWKRGGWRRTLTATAAAALVAGVALGMAFLEASSEDEDPEAYDPYALLAPTGEESVAVRDSARGVRPPCRPMLGGRDDDPCRPLLGPRTEPQARLPA